MLFGEYHCKRKIGSFILGIFKTGIFRLYSKCRDASFKAGAIRRAVACEGPSEQTKAQEMRDEQIDADRFDVWFKRDRIDEIINAANE